MTPRPIDVVIRVDHYGQIIKTDIIHGASTALVAQLSIFGWLFLGPVQAGHVIACTAINARVSPDDWALQLLIKFWVKRETTSRGDGLDHPRRRNRAISSQVAAVASWGSVRDS